MKWIKCSERLPPKDGISFLGYGLDNLHENYECITMIWYAGGKDEEGYDTIEGFFALGQWGKFNREHLCEPTHWMPLPDAPKEEM